MTAAEALEYLKAGNERYAADIPLAWRAGQPQRDRVKHGQTPFACVITCSDSRVPPELIFDCTLGDLFVIRVAGTVQTPEVIGSVEFAVSVLRVPLVVVMAHSNCGAVQAAVSGEEVPERVAAIIDRLAPFVSGAQEQGLSGEELFIHVSKQNTRSLTDALARSRMIRESVDGDVALHRAYYELDSGKVIWDF